MGGIAHHQEQATVYLYTSWCRTRTKIVRYTRRKTLSGSHFGHVAIIYDLSLIINTATKSIYAQYYDVLILG